MGIFGLKLGPVSERYQERVGCKMASILLLVFSFQFSLLAKLYSRELLAAIRALVINP